MGEHFYGTILNFILPPLFLDSYLLPFPLSPFFYLSSSISSSSPLISSLSISPLPVCSTLVFLITNPVPMSLGIPSVSPPPLCIHKNPFEIQSLSVLCTYSVIIQRRTIFRVLYHTPQNSFPFGVTEHGTNTVSLCCSALPRTQLGIPFTLFLKYEFAKMIKDF